MAKKNPLVTGIVLLFKKKQEILDWLKFYNDMT